LGVASAARGFRSNAKSVHVDSSDFRLRDDFLPSSVKVSLCLLKCHFG
jgi:hypothetical protein